MGGKMNYYNETKQELIDNDINRKDIIRVFGKVERRYDKYQVIVNSLKILETKKIS